MKKFDFHQTPQLIWGCKTEGVEEPDGLDCSRTSQVLTSWVYARLAEHLQQVFGLEA